MVCKCRHEEHIGECRVAIYAGPVLVDLCRCTIEKPFPRLGLLRVLRGNLPVGFPARAPLSTANRLASSPEEHEGDQE